MSRATGNDKFKNKKNNEKKLNPYIRSYKIASQPDLNIRYLLRNDAVQDLKLVLILIKAFRNLFCSDSDFKAIIYFNFTTIEFKRPSFTLPWKNQNCYNPMKYCISHKKQQDETILTLNKY